MVSYIPPKNYVLYNEFATDVKFCRCDVRSRLAGEPSFVRRLQSNSLGSCSSISGIRDTVPLTLCSGLAPHAADDTEANNVRAANEAAGDRERFGLGRLGRCSTSQLMTSNGLSGSGSGKLMSPSSSIRLLH